MEFRKYLSPKYILTFSIANYLQSGISFLVTLLLARELDKEDFGNLSYGMVFANTLFIIMQFGTDKTLVRDLVQLKKPELAISSSSWLWLLLGSILLVGIAIWLIFFADLDYSTSFLVLLCSLLGFVRGMTPMPWFDFKGRANFHSLLLLIDRIIFLASVCCIIFLVHNEQAVIYAALAQLISRIFTLTMEWKYVISTCKLVIKPSFPFIQKILKENSWVWLAAIGNLLMTQANQLILNHSFGPSELAIYGFSFQVIMVIRLLQIQVLRLVTPSIAQLTLKVSKNPSLVKKKLFQYCSLNFLLSVVIIAPAYVLAPYLIKTFIGETYMGAVEVLNILFIWSLLFGIAIIINQFLIGLRQQRFYFISTTVFGLLSILLAIQFTEQYKAAGAAVSLLTAHFCSVVFQLIIVLRKINRP